MKNIGITVLAIIILSGFLGSARGQVTTSDAWINEFHYDNTGSDEGEFVEVVIKNSGIYALSDFTLTLYNGSNGESYSPHSETLNNFTVGDTIGDYTLYNLTISGIQNGPDGFALDYNGSLIQFISYGGSFTASGGVADTEVSEDIGITESSSTLEGESLQLTGRGYSYDDFSWSGPSDDSPGETNSGQYLYPTVEFNASGATVSETDGSVNIPVKILNPDGNMIKIDVVFQQNPSSAETGDVGSASQTVTFGTGATEGEIQNASFTLNNDSDYEGEEESHFLLTNLSTSGNAEIDGQTEFILTIEDDETPNVVINEFLADPGGIDVDGSGDYQYDDDEFIELYNNESVSVDISNWTLSDGTVRHTFSEGTILLSNSAIVVFGNPDKYSGIFGGSIVQGANSLGLNNGGDSIILANNEGSTVDLHTYSSGTSGVSVVRDPEGIGNFKGHDEIVGAVGDYSPGTKTDGTLFTTSMVIEGNAGWRMLSAPIENMSFSEIIDDTPIQGFGDGHAKNFYTGYDGTNFTAPIGLSGNFNSGKGYILYFYNNNNAGSSTLPVIIDFSSGSEPAADVTVNLHGDGDKWNLLGNPFQTALSIDSLEVISGSLTSSVAQIWDDDNGSYILSSSNDGKVATGQGFFIQNNDASSLTMPKTGKSSGTRFYKTNEQKGFIQLALISETLNESTVQKDLSTVLYFHSDAESGWDKRDVEKIYPLKGAYSLLNIIPENGEKIKSQDSRTFEDLGEEVFHLDMESMNVKEYQVIRWEKSQNIPETWELLFQDNLTGEKQIMDENFKYEFVHEQEVEKSKLNGVQLSKSLTMNTKAKKSPRFTITVSKGEATGTETKSQPSAFALEQNYPNPFNPTTSIQYSVPETGAVRLTIYNVMGQKVETLVSETQSAGNYRVSWNAAKMASGIYYYRFEAAGNVITRQMTLIK